MSRIQYIALFRPFLHGDLGRCADAECAYRLLKFIIVELCWLHYRLYAVAFLLARANHYLLRRQVTGRITQIDLLTLEDEIFKKWNEHKGAIKKQNTKEPI